MNLIEIGSGFVRLDGALADDLSVVNAARVSFAKKSDYEYDKVLKETDQGLIRFLMKNRHGTPFEHNTFRWHISCPIFVAREWFRHRIGSFNEWSGRYSKLEPVFYTPDAFRTQVGKPGHYKFEEIEDKQVHIKVESRMQYAYKEAWSAYESMLELGVAKEQARAVLPVGIYTEFYWTVNARSMMNFLSLRNHSDAQKEIQEYAEAIELGFIEFMPETAKAFIENNRIAP